MAKATLTLDVAPPRVGLWCDACALPSAIEVDVLHLRPSGVTRLSLIRRCANGPHEQEG